MFSNNIKIALRKFWKRKSNSFTKLFSLSVGLISLFYISIYIHQETSFDNFHQKRSNIYRVNTTDISPTGSLFLGLSAIPVGDYLKSVSPEIIEFVRINKEYGSRAIKYKEKLFSESENIYYADHNFFNLFDFDLLAGNKETALQGPDKIIVTERTAFKYFETTDVLNKTLIYDGEPFTVTGIIQNIPTNSHLQFDFLISMATFLKTRPTATQNWTWFPMNTYLLLHEHADLNRLERRLGEVPEYLPENSEGQFKELSIEPLEGLHFSEPKLGELGPKERLSNLYVLMGIGVMILLLAVSNFINLTTAQITLQDKEVSVKKSMGASKKDIITQFVTESLLFTSLATIISVLVIFGSFSYFEGFMERSFNTSFLSHPLAYFSVPAIPLILTLLGGIYPAIKFSNISPIHLHKKITGRTAFFDTRTSLLVFQFSITSALVICSLLIYRQLNFLQTQDKGLDTKQKIVIDYGPNARIGNAFESLKTAFKSVNGVESVSFSSHIPGQRPNGVGTTITDKEGQQRYGDINLTLVDEDFVKNYGLQIVAGRDFRKGPADLTSALILNESAVKAYGYDNPEDIIGVSHTQWGGDGKVIGVVSDFNYLSLHNDIGLLSLKMWPDQYQKITMDIYELNIKSTIEALRSKWISMYPDIPFKYYFVDDNFKAQYKKDEQFAGIISFFTLISIVIGVLGLVAYATFWCNGRKKEISIRKVLGADAPQLLWKLYKSFSLPVLVGFILAIPVSYYFGNQWLQQFAYQVGFSWIFFVIPLVILLVFICISVGAQTLRLVLSNPVDNLKEE